MQHIHNTQHLYTQLVHIYNTYTLYTYIYIHNTYTTYSHTLCMYIHVYRAHINEVFELYKRAEDLEPNNAEALIAHAQLLSMIG